ncbi:hypothetical protein LX36DRAFT_151267 [Colletotrichum falcatum]|nr:hypothetical protein LX36DRAFT_151267 [Colletotrichum falcatum]
MSSRQAGKPPSPGNKGVRIIVGWDGPRGKLRKAAPRRVPCHAMATAMPASAQISARRVSSAAPLGRWAAGQYILAGNLQWDGGPLAAGIAHGGKGGHRYRGRIRENGDSSSPFPSHPPPGGAVFVTSGTINMWAECQTCAVGMNELDAQVLAGKRDACRKKQTCKSFRQSSAAYPFPSQMAVFTRMSVSVSSLRIHITRELEPPGEGEGGGKWKRKRRLGV